MWCISKLPIPSNTRPIAMYARRFGARHPTGDARPTAVEPPPVLPRTHAAPPFQAPAPPPPPKPTEPDHLATADSHRDRINKALSVGSHLLHAWQAIPLLIRLLLELGFGIGMSVILSRFSQPSTAPSRPSSGSSPRWVSLMPRHRTRKHSTNFFTPSATTYTSRW
jgi:hypothetical protein